MDIVLPFRDGRAPHRWHELAIGAVCFVLGLVVTIAFLPANPDATRARQALIDRKLEQVRARNDWDIVFLGTSRVLSGIDPVAVAAGARAAGCELKVYNFGVVRLSLVEADDIAIRLRQGNPSLRVVTEGHLSWVSPRVDSPARFSEEIAYIRAKHGRFDLDFLADLTELRFLAARRMWPASAPEVALSPEGYPHEDPPVQRRAWPTIPDRPASGELRLPYLEYLSGRLANVGSTLVFLPSAAFVERNARIVGARAHLQAAGWDVHSYTHPANFPELYRAAYWLDPDHLNRAGAAVFSRLLGRHFCERRD